MAAREATRANRFAEDLDRSAQTREIDLQARLRQNHAKLLRTIDAALRRIDRQTFGVCEACDQPTPAARLNVVPWATLCRDCKEQQDSQVAPPRPPWGGGETPRIN
jgi:DnaK suppressor protein